MADAPGPFTLADMPAIFTPSGTAHPKAFSATFFDELDGEFDGFAGHVLVTTFAFDQAWPTWEIHPHGDELVYLLAGDTDFLLKKPGTDPSAEPERVRVREPGDYVVVPRNTWHTAVPHTPTRMLFVTPGEGTRNAESPD